jgi:hypothetical protein
MEMHDLPDRAAFRDHKRDATVVAVGLAISHPSNGIQTSDHYGCIGQHNDRMFTQRSASRAIVEQCLLEICSYLA